MTQTRTFRNFDLDTRYMLPFTLLSDEILIESLQGNQTTTLKGEDTVTLPDTPENIVLGAITDLDPGIPLAPNMELFYKLIGQLFAFVGKGKGESDLAKLVLYYKNDFALLILEQMKRNVALSDP